MTETYLKLENILNTIEFLLISAERKKESTYTLANSISIQSIDLNPTQLLSPQSPYSHPGESNPFAILSRTEEKKIPMQLKIKIRSFSSPNTKLLKSLLLMTPTQHLRARTESGSGTQRKHRRGNIRMGEAGDTGTRAEGCGLEETGGGACGCGAEEGERHGRFCQRLDWNWQLVVMMEVVGYDGVVLL